MPRHMTMWLAAGGSALVGASLTYLMTRPAPSPLTSPVRTAWDALSARVSRARSRHRETAAQSGASHATGNSSFDGYRATLMRKLDDDERDFQNFLETLRGARDREEFDRFMDERRNPRN